MIMLTTLEWDSTNPPGSVFVFHLDGEGTSLPGASMHIGASLLCERSSDWCEETESGSMKMKTPWSNWRTTRVVSWIQNQPVLSVTRLSQQLSSLSWFFSRRRNHVHAVFGLLERTTGRRHDSVTIQVWGTKSICSLPSISLNPTKGLVVSFCHWEPPRCGQAGLGFTEDHSVSSLCTFTYGKSGQSWGNYLLC